LSIYTHMDKRLISKIRDYRFENLSDLHPVVVQGKNSTKEVIALVSQSIPDPLLVTVNSNGIASVDYEGLCVALISVIKQLEARIKELEINSKQKPKKA
jgi:hypothetical protein